MDLSPDVLANGLVWYVAFLFSVTVHEAAHAYAAFRLGDPTAFQGGQVTLNPIPHIQREPIGTILVPAFTFLTYGWMMGWASAPYDPHWALRYPRRAAWMALAGPLSNLIVVACCAVSIRLLVAASVLELAPSPSFSAIVISAAGGGFSTGLATLLSILFCLNLLLFVFNLFPLPPLDGSAVLPLFLSSENSQKYLEFIRQPAFNLLGLVVAWRFFGPVFRPIFSFSLALLGF